MVISDPRHTSCASTVHHVPKCMSCHKAIVVIIGRAHCFHDYIYIYIYIYMQLKTTVSLENIVGNISCEDDTEMTSPFRLDTITL